MSTRGHEPFSVTATTSDDEIVLTPSGEVDIQAAPRLLEAGDKALDDGAQKLTIDCHQIRFIDSSGIRVLTLLTQRCRTQGVTFRLTHAPKLVTAVLRVSGLDELLDDPADASTVDPQD